MHLLIDTSFPVVASMAECLGDPRGSTKETHRTSDITAFSVLVMALFSSSSYAVAQNNFGIEAVVWHKGP